MGGAVSAIEQGFIQEQIASSSYKYTQAIERNEKIIVGVNKYVSNDGIKIPIMKIDDSIQQTQIAQLTKFKANRNQEEVKQKLDKIVAVANSSENLMPSVIDAVEAHCTLGEIANVLRGVWGEYK